MFIEVYPLQCIMVQMTIIIDYRERNFKFKVVSNKGWILR